MAWSGGLAHWVENGTAFVSVAFSWKIKEAVRLCEYYKQRGHTVRVGGTILGVPQNARSFAGIAEIGGAADALVHHNPEATIASRGCPVGCWFCIVPKIEGKEFTLLWDFWPRPVLCDNNLSALPVEFQEHIIKRYIETGTSLLDANSGFEPMTFDEGTYRRWKAILRGAWRFALDEMRELGYVERMMWILKSEPPSKKRVYVLIGNEPIVSCYERVQKVIEWGGEPYCQAVLPLNATSRHQYRILFDWDSEKLEAMMRWANRFLWRSVPLRSYAHHVNREAPFATAAL